MKRKLRVYLVLSYTAAGPRIDGVFLDRAIAGLRARKLEQVTGKKTALLTKKVQDSGKFMWITHLIQEQARGENPLWSISSTWHITHDTEGRMYMRKKKDAC